MTNRAIALLALSLAALCLSGAGSASAAPAQVCRVAGGSQQSVKLACSAEALLSDLVAALGTDRAVCFPTADLKHWECVR